VVKKQDLLGVAQKHKILIAIIYTTAVLEVFVV
jgi:hypothetical protein